MVAITGKSSSVISDLLCNAENLLKQYPPKLPDMNLILYNILQVKSDILRSICSITTPKANKVTVIMVILFMARSLKELLTSFSGQSQVHAMGTFVLSGRVTRNQRRVCEEQNL